MIGDIVGRPGRRAVQEIVPSLRKDLDIDLVIANGENSAGGFGITFDTAQEILDSGVNVITSGNHIWKNLLCCQKGAHCVDVERLIHLFRCQI